MLVWYLSTLVNLDLGSACAMPIRSRASSGVAARDLF